jgi:hypothetical protein
MSLFRRCKHEWEAKAVQHYTVKEKYIWEDTWSEMGDETIIRYVCSKCKDDTKRTVMGDFSLTQAKEVFPKP